MLNRPTFGGHINFLLLLFPALVTVFCSVSQPWQRLVTAGAGLLALLVFYVPLIRTYFKLDIIQKITYKIKVGGNLDSNPIVFIQKQFKKLPRRKRLIDASSYSLIMWGLASMIVFMLALVIWAAIKMP